MVHTRGSTCQETAANERVRETTRNEEATRAVSEWKVMTVHHRFIATNSWQTSPVHRENFLTDLTGLSRKTLTTPVHREKLWHHLDLNERLCNKTIEERWCHLLGFMMSYFDEQWCHILRNCDVINVILCYIVTSQSHCCGWTNW